MLTEALWLPDQHKENSIYIFPTAGTIADLVQERVDEPINNDPYLSSIIGRGVKMMDKQTDKMGMKRLGKGFIYFRGANKPTQITSISGDCIFVDELDRMPPENIPYFDKRMEHSDRKWERWASTPTIPNFGIDKKFRESDQHHCYVKCECGEWQTLTFWDNVDQDNELLVCKKCRKEIVPWHLDLEWRPHKPENEIRGYFINQLYSPRLNIKKVVEESRKTAEWEVQQFYNQVLGLAYEPKGAKITEADLDACIRKYIIPMKTQESFMGVDVGRVLHVIIRDKTKVLYIGEHKEFEELDKLMAEYNIKKVVIDALPETRKVQEFINKFPGRAHLCYYSGLKEIKEHEWFKLDGQKVNTDRTLSLDISTNEIKQQDIELPQNLGDYPDFKNHCKNLIRVVSETKAGNKVAEYVKTGEDHYRHSFNYATIARHIFDKNVEPEIFVF